MITLENRFFPVRSAVCLLVEGVIIVMSVISSFYILQKVGNVGSVELQDVILRGLVVAFFCQACMYLLDLYDLKHSHTWEEIFFSLIFAVGTVCIGIGIVSFVIPEFGVHGKVYYITIVLVTALLLVWRILFDYYLSHYASKENILIVGNGDIARMLGQEVKLRERLGLSVVGFVGSPSSELGKRNGSGDVIGNYGDLKGLLEENNVRKVVVAIEERRGEYPVKEMLQAKISGCDVVEWQDFFEKLSGRIPIQKLAPSFFIFREGFRKSRMVLFIRRVISLILALTGLLLLFPVFMLVGIAIKLDSPGPIFYSQERVGQFGKGFRLLKFRSMRQDAESDGIPRWATQGDPRVTRVGKYIRLTRLDELPQLINVLRGDQDLVGPRPERPSFVEELEKVIPYYSIRHTVKPGLTGWAQVMFPYAGTIHESKEKLEYDLYYIKNMSTKLDVLIILMTFKVLILGRGAK